VAAFAAESKFLAQHVEAARILRHKEEAHQYGEDLDSRALIHGGETSVQPVVQHRAMPHILVPLRSFDNSEKAVPD
jgi:hypothetical protein